MYNENNRPKQRVKTEFLEYSSYDISIPWSVFKTEPVKQDFSVVKENAYFVDIYAQNDGDGTLENPYNDVQKSIDLLKSGDTLYIRGGFYPVSQPVKIWDKSGITISSYGEELAIFDGMPFENSGADFLITGLVSVARSNDIVIKNIKCQNSRCKGIEVYNSNNVEIYHCETENTFSCGISVWDHKPTPEKENEFRGFKIIGNKIIKSNTFDMLPVGIRKRREPPHEAISIAGVSDFEVAFNDLYACQKEGIDIKENSTDGYVHHNYIHDCFRQALYADAWFGTLKNVHFEYNIALNNKGAGLAVSVEGVDSYLENVSYKNNIVYGSYGAGMMVSRWGKDLLRENIVVSNNTFVRNGHGGTFPAKEVFWQTGGVEFLSANVNDFVFEKNILSENCNFEIGFSDYYDNIVENLKEKNIVIKNNLINDTNKTEFPIKLTWPESFSTFNQYLGEDNVLTVPKFKDLENLDFRIIDENNCYGAKIDG